MERCRLCQGATEKQFSLQVLDRFDVDYSLCSDCGSLQTEEPYWLDEAYKLSLTFNDVGAVDRCLESRAAVLLIAKHLSTPKFRLLDFGGGHGLLCRLLRDVGTDAWTFDSVNRSDFAQAFSVDLNAVEPGTFDIVTAFEVLEHFPQPENDLTGLFRLAPQILITSTEPYEAGYGRDWWYLIPTTGQHVFFYSHKALHRIAERFGYHLYEFGLLQVFSRPPINSLTHAILRAGLSRRGRRVLRVMNEWRPKSQYISRDFQMSLAAEKRGNPGSSV